MPIGIYWTIVSDRPISLAETSHLTLSKKKYNFFYLLAYLSRKSLFSMYFPFFLDRDPVFVGRFEFFFSIDVGFLMFCREKRTFNFVFFV